MNRTRRSFWIAATLFVAMTAAAQEGEYEPPPEPVTDEGDDPGSLEEAQQTGRSVTLGGQHRAQTVPEVYFVKPGDTLWGITGRYYPSPWEWPRVWSYNPAITNPHWIYPQNEIRLKPGTSQPATLPDGTGAQVAATGTGGGEVILLRTEGYLDADALREIGTIAGAPEEHMLLAPNDRVYAQFEVAGARQPGQEYAVFRRINLDKERAKEKGVLVRVSGTVKLQSYNAKDRVARGVITEALEPIERGFQLAPVQRRFELVPARPSRVNLKARVAAFLEPLEFAADQQILFVDAGSKHGVASGNRFLVVRVGDEWRKTAQTSLEMMGATVPDAKEVKKYPEEIVAEARVVHVRPRSSTCVVTRAVRAIEVGDRAELRRGY